MNTHPHTERLGVIHTAIFVERIGGESPEDHQDVDVRVWAEVTHDRETGVTTVKDFDSSIALCEPERERAVAAILEAAGK